MDDHGTRGDGDVTLYSLGNSHSHNLVALPFARSRAAASAPLADISVTSLQNGVMPEVHKVLALSQSDEFLRICDLLDMVGDLHFEVEHTANVKLARARLATGEFKVCVADEQLLRAEGLAACERLAIVDEHVPTIVIGDGEDRSLEIEAARQGFVTYLDRCDLDAGSLERAIRFAAGQHDHWVRCREVGNNFLDHTLTQALAVARRQRHHVALALIELGERDRNGDAVVISAPLLIHLASSLKSSLRQTDTVAHVDDHTIAVVLGELRRPEAATMIANKMLDTVAELLEAMDQPCPVSAIGFAVSPADGETAGALVASARAAARRAGASRDRDYAFASDKLDRRVRRNALLGSDLKLAFERDELVLHFRPQVTLSSPTLGLTSVLRWNHPILGFVEADQFRLLAEDTGRMEALTRWTITAACQQARQWQRCGYRRFHLSLPILSRRQIAWGALPDWINDELQRFGLPRAILELELSEALLLEELDAGGAGFRTLAASGLRVACDGFGGSTGSLRLLREAPLQTVKFPTSLFERTDGMTRSPAAVTSALIRLCREIDLRTVVSGSCSKELLVQIRAAGCDAVEAPMSASPLPAEVCESWLQSASRRVA